MERPIFITVGGRPFTVLQSTLTSHSTYFKNLEDKLDGMFIPRDGELFSYCLRFLYGNREFISELSVLNQWSLWREAEFFQMKELSDVLQDLLRPKPTDDDVEEWKMQGTLVRSVLLSMWPHIKRMYEEVVPAVEPVGHVLFEHLNDAEAFLKLWHCLMVSSVGSGVKNRRRRPEDAFQQLKAAKDDPLATEGAGILNRLISRLGLACMVAMFAQRVDPGAVPPPAAPPPPPDEDGDR